MADSAVLPLDGVRVLELAHLIAGPVCGMYLADMGADVIKVESRDAPDAGRDVYPALSGRGRRAPPHGEPQQARDRARPAAAGGARGVPAARRRRRRGDRGLSRRGGGAAGHRLGLAHAPQPAPHLLLDLGLRAPRALAREARPRLAGPGPRRLHGHHRRARRRPGAGGAPVADTLGAHARDPGHPHRADRARAQRAGQRVDASLLDGMLLRPYRAAHRLPRDRRGAAALRERPSRDRALPGLRRPRTAGSSWPRGWIGCGCPSARRWAWTRSAPIPRFATRQDRLAHRGELETILAPVFRARPVAHWMDVLEQADVLCAPVNDYPMLVRHPQVVATGFITEQHHPRAGTFKTVATPVKLEKTPGTIRTPAPAAGRAQPRRTRRGGLHAGRDRLARGIGGSIHITQGDASHDAQGQGRGGDGRGARHRPRDRAAHGEARRQGGGERLRRGLGRRGGTRAARPTRWSTRSRGRAAQAAASYDSVASMAGGQRDRPDRARRISATWTSW